jgi:thiol-disulfide isomerase/thioredoxin
LLAVVAARRAAIVGVVLIAREVRADELERHVSIDPSVATKPRAGAVAVSLSQATVYESGEGWQGVAKVSAWAFFPPIWTPPIYFRLELPALESQTSVRAGSLLAALHLRMPGLQVGSAVEIEPTGDVGIVTPSLGGGSLRVAGTSFAEVETTFHYGLTVPVVVRPPGLGFAFWSTPLALFNLEASYEHGDVLARGGVGFATESVPARWFGSVGLKLSPETELGAFATRVIDDRSHGAIFGLSARIALPGYWRPSQATPETPASADLRYLHEDDVRGRDLAALASPGKVTLVEFGADWCAPCRAARPGLEQIAKRSDVAVRIVDVDELGGFALRFGVSALPTFLVVGRDGRVLTRVEGLDWTSIRAALPPP